MIVADKKAVIMESWVDNIMNDPYVETSSVEMGCILYAAVRYWYTGEKEDIGELCGEEYRGLNRSMSNIYSQIDKMRPYIEGGVKKSTVYDHDRIRELRLEGKTGREICSILGLDASKEKSLSTTRGWKEAKAILESHGPKNTESVQNTEKSVQTVTDTENTESVQIGKDSVQTVPFNF